MPKVTYVQPDGTTDALDVPVGTSIMEAALEVDLPGIVAECGGAAMCATCHVYVRSDHLGVAPEMQEDEDEMLDEAACSRADNSRLSCQLELNEKMEGIVVAVPERQRAEE